MEKSIIHPDFPDTHSDVSSKTIFGFWVYLMTDLVMFASFFACFVVLRHGTFGGPTAADLFHLPYALVESLVLLGSSFSVGIAMLSPRREKQKKMVFWFGLSFVLGLVFLFMQVSEFKSLFSQGYTWQTSAFLSAYYTVIGLHSLHLLVAMALLVLFLWQMSRWGLVPMVLRRLTCLRIFWQFLYLIWIFTFTFVYIIGSTR